MRSLAVATPQLALTLALYALAILLPLVGATTILTFSDKNCRTRSGLISAKDSPGSGECTKLTSGLTSFMIGDLGDGCTVTIYGDDPKDPICSATNLELAETTVCYNSSWVYFSVDECTPTSSVSTSASTSPTASTTSTATTTSTPNSDSNGVNVGAVIGGTVSGVFVVAVIIGGTLYFFWFRPKQQRKMAELSTRPDTSTIGINNPYSENDASANPDPYKNDTYTKPAELPNGPDEVYELSPQYIAEVHEQTHVRHELPP
ncbi:hypothetical protein F4860DRAFT_172942 [Xylaria cubensis]|nr:hypothetical protein F4860DRAFT_172942 [Xylaria cubensis]